MCIRDSLGTVQIFCEMSLSAIVSRMLRAQENVFCFWFENGLASHDWNFFLLKLEVKWILKIFCYNIFLVVLFNICWLVYYVCIYLYGLCMYSFIYMFYVLIIKQTFSKNKYFLKVKVSSEVHICKGKKQILYLSLIHI